MKNKENIVIIGASGHAKVIIDIVEKENNYNIVGLIDSYKKKGHKKFQYKILGTENELIKLTKQYNFIAGIIAIGDNWTRKLMYDSITNIIPNFEFVIAIHPDAVIGKEVSIGRGTVIMPGVIINSLSKIGDFCILNTKASLDHDGKLENFSSLAPNVTIGGNVTIGSFSAICLGANVIQDITIGKHSIVGAGALIIRNLESYKMTYGVPAKIVKSVKKGEKYLYHQDTNSKKPVLPLSENKLEIITEKKDWDDFLREIKKYDFYHTYDYHELSKSSNETPVLFKYVENDITIGIPLLVRNITNTIYKDATSVYGYSGPVCSGINRNFNNSKFKKALTQYFNENNIISVFSRLNPFIQDQDKILSNIGVLTSQGKVVNINLTENIEIQRQKYQSRLKTHINKARRNCSIVKGTTAKDIEEFMDIYYENMNRVGAKKYYFFKKEYFEKMMASKSYKSYLLLAKHVETGKTIAGAQFIVINNIVQYHLSGTKNDFLHLMPTKVLIDEMRLIASKEGYTCFNLGGGIGGRNDDSLFNFKASFSKDFKDFNLWKFIVNKDLYDKLVLEKGINHNSEYFPLYRYLEYRDA